MTTTMNMALAEGKIGALQPTLSAELFVIPLDAGKSIVYAPLRRAAFIADDHAVNLLADIQEGCFDQRDDLDGAFRTFLRSVEMLDAEPEIQPLTIMAGTPAPTSVTLFLTTACNLRCTYCYASAGDTPVRNMPMAVARKGIDFVLANALKQGAQGIDITYHGGGEPTVNWKVLTQSWEYARARTREHGLDLFATSGSNGVLSDSQIDWITGHLNRVSLSFDGLPGVHDRHRPTVAGQGSSHRVMHTMARFDAAGFNYGVRMTVTADQIAQLPESVEFVCARFKPSRIQVEPSYQLGRWRDAASAETEGFLTAYRQAHARARSHGCEIFFSGARLGLLSNHFCGVSQDGFSLSPDGNVSACYESFSEAGELASTFFYGKSAADGYQFQMEVLENLRNQALQHRPYCQGCFAKWSCGGDCYHKALSANPGEAFQGSPRCHVIRELTKDQILDRIAQAGGGFWHEAPESVVARFNASTSLRAKEGDRTEAVLSLEGAS